jgi:hypothetical protein
MPHTYNEKDTCTSCGCSKGFAEKNNIECKTPKLDTIKLKPKLLNSDIHHFVGKIRELNDSATDEEIKNVIYTKQVYSYHPAEYDWFISEYRGNKERWIEIYENIQKATQPVEYEEEKWKPDTVITIERNPMTGAYKIINVKYVKKGTPKAKV